MDGLKQDWIQSVQDRLLNWFAVNKRDLPWRRSRDPYAILVSEVMLQQTQVDRVIPYFEQFMTRFPTVESLAEASTADLIRFWSGLGYNRRAVNLQQAAQKVVHRWNGKFPDAPEILSELPGVGKYTAGAIAAFAFERDVAFLDTNMRRTIERVAFGRESDSAVSARRETMAAAGQLVPAGKGWIWNQALIEFGALQCTARNPACIVCPLQAQCAAWPSIQNQLAEKRKRTDAPAAEPFPVSNRFYRGKVVEILRGLDSSDGALPLKHLGPQLKEGFSEADLPWLRGLVSGLERDGLAVIRDAPASYVTDDAAQEDLRVALP